MAPSTPGSTEHEPGTRRAGRWTAILSKRPAPGRVKTRLVPPLTPEGASDLAEAMLRDAVERCSACGGFRTVLWFAPASEEAWFRSAFPGLELRPQRGEGLGARLASAFEEGLGAGAAATLVAIGSDQPLVSTERIEAAHAALEDGADLVLGPDAGGGYYLVGLRAPSSSLFTEVPMSAPGMCAETVRRAESLGLAVHLLERGYDVDVQADLERLRSDLVRLRAPGRARDREFPRHTDDILQRLLPLEP
jgi:rSAM/selenodomain-associated transferase 1